MPHTDRNDETYFLAEGVAYRCRQGQILPQLWIVENAKRKKEPRRLLFSTGSRVFQALDPSIKRYAQTKRLLARRSLGALKRLRDLASAGTFPSECFQGSHICCRPRTPFSVFHDRSLQIVGTIAR